jgi:hypothetical protein
LFGILRSTEGINVTITHCKSRGVPRTTQIMPFINQESGLNLDIEQKQNKSPNGIAITKVSAKSFSVMPKPMHRSYKTDQKFIKSSVLF